MRSAMLTVLGGLAVALFVGATVMLSNPAPASAANATEIAAGGDHSCAIVAGGAVKCWGDNDNGQLGNNDAPNDSSAPVDVCTFFLFFCSNVSGMTDISAGFNHTCAVTGGGGVQCWGDNSRGQLGNDNDPNDADTPVNVCAGTFLFGPPPCDSNLANVEQVAVGDVHSCALISGGTVKCWGSNTNGQLGDGTTTDRSTPVTVCDAPGLFFGCSPSLTDVVQIAAGASHTCALHSDGSVSCWGDNAFGQLGNNDAPNDSDTAVTVCATTLLFGDPCSSDLAGVDSIGAGSGYTCAVMDAGRAKCWGHNASGQLGNGFTTDRSTPVDVCVSAGFFGCDPALDGVDEIRDAGGLHTCVLMDDTGVMCWGENARGQLGNGDAPDDSVAPVDACVFIFLLFTCLPVTGYESVSAGDNHTCAATSSGGIQCWGESDPNGQVGDGASVNRDRPTNVVTLGPKEAPTPTATATATSPDPTATPTNTSPGPTTTATATSPGGVLIGDVNCDGLVNAIDALFVLQFIAGLLPAFPCPDAADVDGSGAVTAIDAALILQHAAGLITLPS